MPQRLRVFISSPGDVPSERLRTFLVIDKISQEFSRFFAIETYRWEHEPMLASGTFQDAIQLPSQHDIVILILWSRLGTALPEATATRQYRGIDDRAPVTGTEWEFEDALKKARSAGAPDILAFRNVSPAPIDTFDLAAQAKSLEQLNALNNFWRRHFIDRGVFMAAYDEYRSIEEFAERLERSFRKLIERRIKALDLSALPPAWPGSPFRGLEAYDFEHAPIFFGRDAVVATAAERLTSRAREGTAFFIMSGSSGSGKSSLVKAALVPHLMKPQRLENVAIARRAVFKPSDSKQDLLLGFLESLTRHSQPSNNIGLPELLAPGQDVRALAEHLRSAPETPAFIFDSAMARVTETGRRSGHFLAHEHAKLIVVIDQMEELFTIPAIGADDRRLFARFLAALARSGSVWIVATIRADFWHRLAEIPELNELCQGAGRHDVSAPSPAELAEMIRKPAEAAGLAFEIHRQSGLRLDAVLAEAAAAAPGVLPLLSFTLEALYDEDILKNHGRTLTHATYESLGGLKGAIARRANETLELLPESAQKALPRALRALANVSGDSDQTPVARMAPLASFKAGSDVRGVVDALINARLLVATSDGDEPMVRIAHEALIGSWKRAKDVLVAERRDLETRLLIERQFGRWEQAAAADKHKLLLRDPDLTNALDLEQRWSDELSRGLRDFIAKSEAAAKAASRRRWMIAAAVMIALAGFAAASLGAFYVAQNQRNSALIAQSQFLARDANIAITKGDATLGALLAVSALPRRLRGPNRPFVKEAEYALENAYANRRELRILHGHTKIVWSVRFSPDGTRLITASDDGTARVWDVAAGTQVAELRGHGGAVTFAAFSPDGKRVATTSDDATARLWDARTGAPTALLQGHREFISTAAFSPDGERLVTAADDHTARLWDAQSGAQIAELHGHKGPVNAVAFSPADDILATSSTDGTIRIWSPKTGAEIRVISAHNAFVNSIAFSPDGRRIVSSSNDRTARQWDVASGNPIHKSLEGHDANVLDAKYSPDGLRIVTASEDKTARVWDATTGALIGVLRGHEAAVRSATFSQQGRVVTASNDGTARLWNADTASPISILSAHNGLIAEAVFSTDGRQIATVSADATARLWNAEVGAAGLVLMGHEKWVNWVGFSPDGNWLVTASDDNSVRIWDAETGRALDALPKHGASVRTAAFSADGKRVVTASDDYTARIWDIAGRKDVRVLHPGGRVWAAAFSQDGRRVVTGSENQIAIVWDAESGSELLRLPGHKSMVSTAAFSPDGIRIVTGSWDRTARLWDAKNGSLIAELKGHDGRIASVAFSADGEMIVSASDDKTARLWNGRTGELLGVLRGHGNWLYTAAFSLDGKRIITSSQDTTAMIWDAKDMTPIAVLRGHGAPIRAAAFSPDGKRAATASSDTTVRLWALPPRCAALIDWGRNEKSLPRGITAEESDVHFIENARTESSVLTVLARWASPLLPKAGDVCE